MVVLNDRTRKARVAEEMRENSKPIYQIMFTLHTNTHTQLLASTKVSMHPLGDIG